MPDRIKTISRRRLLLAAAAMTALVSANAAMAQSWPQKPIHVINPYAPGGPSDNLIRLLAEGLTVELGQPVIVESKAGGGTVIGAAYVAKAAPDGYTLLMATVAPLIVQPAINAGLPYDAQRDFRLVGMYATVPNLIAVNPSLPVNSIKELIEYARANPGKLNFASAGAGTGPHLGGELFNRLAKVQMTHVAYAGAAPAVLGVLGGQVQVSFVNITPQLQHVKAGKLRPLAMGGSQRSELLPDVPTVAESGLPGFVSESWNGIAAPAGTPKAIVDKLYGAMEKVMNTAKTKEALAALGAQLTLAGPQAFEAYVKEDTERQVPLIKELGLKAN